MVSEIGENGARSCVSDIIEEERNNYISGRVSEVSKAGSWMKIF
jgi:hypothetical protein